MEIKISKSALDSFEKQINRRTIDIMSEAIKQSKGLLFKKAETLANKVVNSSDYQALFTTLVGEFGFTPEELGDVRKIYELLIPENTITSIRINTNGNKQFAILDWVDYDALKTHPLAQHKLTRLNRETNTFEVQQVVSWIEWLEEGATVLGYTFSDKTATDRGRYSRSKQGIMRETGGLWAFKPTRLFEETAKLDNIEDLKKGFAAILKRIK